MPIIEMTMMIMLMAVIMIKIANDISDATLMNRNVRPSNKYAHFNNYILIIHSVLSIWATVTSPATPQCVAFRTDNINGLAEFNKCTVLY